MKEDHASQTQQALLPDQAQFIEHGIPIVISIDKDTVVSSSKIWERIEAVTFLDRHPSVAGVLESKICVETGVNDCMRNTW
jgi:hypothetical protein